mgnify:CR=1 FL=1
MVSISSMAAAGTNCSVNTEGVASTVEGTPVNTSLAPASQQQIGQPSSTQNRIAEAGPCGGAGPASSGNETGSQPLPWMRGPRPTAHTGAMSYTVPVPKTVGQQATPQWQQRGRSSTAASRGRSSSRHRSRSASAGSRLSEMSTARSEIVDEDGQHIDPEETKLLMSLMQRLRHRWTGLGAHKCGLISWQTSKQPGHSRVRLWMSSLTSSAGLSTRR